MSAVGEAEKYSLTYDISTPYSDKSSASSFSAKKSASGRELSEDEIRQVKTLKARDMEVKRHESAHIAAGGQYVRGGARFEYTVGPDGKKYAVGGEVSIDTSPIKDDPQATIEKMRIVRKAALAPGDPSAADHAVAAKASQQEIKAQMELREKTSSKTQAGGKPAAKEPENRSAGKSNSSYSSNGLPISSAVDVPATFDIYS